MKNHKNIYSDLKQENKKRVFDKILEAGSISATSLGYELLLSRPTVKQNLDELLNQGIVYESGSVGHTGGRRARTYSIVSKSRVAVGIDLTRNHITVIIVDLYENLIYEKRVRYPFALTDSYMRYLGKLVEEAIDSQEILPEAILGVGIAVPGLITEDHKEIFYGEILGFTGVTVEEFAKYIPYPCRLYNDANAAGYAEISVCKDLTDAFYISLSNNIGGSILIDHKVYKGKNSRSGEIGHMTIASDGRTCYCGQKGCFETYCNATILSDLYNGELNTFFKNLEDNDAACVQIWEEYLEHLIFAVNNIRMLLDCEVILGGYVGAYLEKYILEIKEKLIQRNSFEKSAEYVRVCKVKKEALALGSALPFIHELKNNI